jgi:hypothetical protein
LEVAGTVGGAGGVALAAGTLKELDGFAAGAFASPSAYGSDPESSRADRPARKSPRLLCLICPGSLRQEAVSKFEEICGRVCKITYSPRCTNSESEFIEPASTEDKRAASANEKVK